jgi:hypothetical protein
VNEGISLEQRHSDLRPCILSLKPHKHLVQLKSIL